MSKNAPDGHISGVDLLAAIDGKKLTENFKAFGVSDGNIGDWVNATETVATRLNDDKADFKAINGEGPSWWQRNKGTVKQVAGPVIATVSLPLSVSPATRLPVSVQQALVGRRWLPAR